jgi:filamentous hemagglutinin family protein
VALRLSAIRLTVALALLASAPHLGSAQSITIDGSLGPKARTLLGPSYTIGADLGKQVGHNLFQSFGKFNLANGESANFTGPPIVSNIIGRVTGGDPSSIDGKIQSSIGGANLYLINPSGIVFGPNATVDVSGSFHAASADYVRMSDGARFQATNPGGSTFSAAPPTAFGFLGPTPAAITVNGSTLGPVPRTLGLVGGPVTINGGSLTAPAGTIRVTSAAGAGEVPVDAQAGPAATVTRFGRVAISNGAKLDVSDPKNRGSGGSVLIRAGALTVDASDLNVDNYGAGSGGQLRLRADSEIILSNGANLHSVAQATGAGADVSVSTAALRVTEGAALTSDTMGSGGGGVIAITADTLVLDGGPALDQSTGVFANSSGIGNGGPIRVSARQVALHDGAGLLTQSNADGAGGKVMVTASGSAIIDSGASLGSVANAGGAAGDVSVTASGPITIDMTIGADVSLLDGIASATQGGGDAGNVTVKSGTMALLADGVIFSGTFGEGNSGAVSVTVSGALTINGGAAEVLFTGIGAAAEPGSTGNAGNVEVTAGTLSMAQNGVISSGTYGGNGGEVTVDVAGALTIRGTPGNLFFTGIDAASQAGSSGKAGNVNVAAATLSIFDNGAINASTGNSANGGEVSVAVAGALTIDGSGANPQHLTGIGSSSQRSATGAGGDVKVTAGTLNIARNGNITASTSSPGAGGNVQVSAGAISLSGPGGAIAASSGSTGRAGSLAISSPELEILDDARISTSAASANGGNISLSIGDLLYLRQGAITTSVNGTLGNGGNILVDPQRLVLDRSQIIAQAVGGNGGNITIQANNYLASADSLVSASSQLGISGTVSIIGQEMGLNGGLVPLPSDLRGAAAIEREACGGYRARPRSSLSPGGATGVPPDLDLPAPALYLGSRDRMPSSPQAHRPNASPAPIRLALRCE